MMNLKEIFKHYADDLGEGADIRKEAIASIEQAAEHIDEHTLRHHSRLLAIAYLALEAETTQIIDGCCTACGALMDCCEAADYKFCPYCAKRIV